MDENGYHHLKVSALGIPLVFDVPTVLADMNIEVVGLSIGGLDSFTNFEPIVAVTPHSFFMDIALNKLSLKASVCWRGLLRVG